MKKLFVCSALLCTCFNAFAQTKGMIVEDKSNGISYEVTESSLVSSNTISSKEDVSKAKADDKLSTTPLPGLSYLSQPFMNFDGKANLHITTVDECEETRECKVNFSSVSGSNKERAITVFEANGSYSTTSQEVKKGSVDFNTNMAEYEECTKKLINYCKSKSLSISVNGLYGDAIYMSYNDVIAKYPNISIFKNNVNVKKNLAQMSKEQKDALCILFVKGAFGTETAFVVETVDIYETISTNFHYTSTCTPKNVTANAEWNNANVTVDECIDFVEEGAFATAGIVTRKIGENNAYHEAVAARSNKGNARIGVYVGKNVNVGSVKEFINGIEGKKGLCFVEFYSTITNSTNKVIELPEETNPNCLLFFPKNSKVSGNNVVINSTCANLVLNRESSTPFYNIKKFKATNLQLTNLPLSYGKFAGYCFPFSINGKITLINGNAKKTDYVKNLLTIAEFNEFKDSSLSFNIINNEKSRTNAGIKANTPCVMALKAEGEFTELKASNVQIEATEPDVDLSTEIKGGWRMIGSYQAIKFVNEAYSYYGLQDNKLKKATINSTTLKPFSAVLVQLDETCVPDLNARIRVEEPEVVEEEETTGIEEISADSAINEESSNNTMSSNMTIVSLSGKVIYKGKANNEVQMNLPAGIYIINGKKCIIK